MKVKIKMNLKQAERYFDLMRRGKMKRACLNQIAISLTNHLWQYVFTNAYMVFDVQDKSAMRRLIKAKSVPPLAKYNDVYLRNMMAAGKLPHGSLRQNTHIDIFWDRVLFYIPEEATTATSITKAGKVHVYNYGPVHERKKSILKSTVVFAWQDILKRIGSVYKTYAERL